MAEKKKTNSLRKVFITAFLIYIAAVLYITILSRPAEDRRFDLEPFRSYVLLFRDKNYFYLYQTACNILMTVPFGILLPLISRKFCSMRKIVFLGFLFSFMIEIIQYITCRGLCEFDDLFNNTVGAGTGYLIFFIFIHIIIKKHKSR
ncbi:MAG: VanZ family protein [Clostridia bacterium]|nr:VanZ family protein [Clostridia bacterium]